jgi:hypothetical protein
MAHQPPGVADPWDTNEISAGRYLTVQYSTPGQIVVFNRDGIASWRYRPAGSATLSRPLLALPLPSGDTFATDDANHRIVVDPRTNRVHSWSSSGVSGQSRRDGPVATERPVVHQGTVSEGTQTEGPFRWERAFSLGLTYQARLALR